MKSRVRHRFIWTLIALMQFFAFSYNAHATSTSIPQHNTRVTYDFATSQSTAYNYDYFITFNGPNSTRSGLGLYSQFSFGFQAGPIGYLGLQKEINQHKVIFSIWDANNTSVTALPATSDSCVRFGHEGSGTMCISTYNWIPDREYRLRLWNLGSNSQATGQTWWVGIQDTVTQIETHVGSILLLNTNGFQGYGYLDAKNGWPIVVNEYYGASGQNIECDDLPLFNVTGRGPFANNNDNTGARTLPLSARVNYSGFGVGTDCPNNNVFSNAPHAVTIVTGANTQRITPDRSNVWSKLNQTITFGTTPTLIIGGTGSVSSTASSGLAVSYSSLTSSVCTVSGSTVTGVSAGTCTIAANQSGNAGYSAAAQVTQSIQVTPSQNTTLSQTIGAMRFSPSTLSVGGVSVVSATATSGLPVAFSSTTSSICTVTPSQASLFSPVIYNVTGVSAGICRIAANQAGGTVLLGGTFNAAPQTIQNITVGSNQYDCIFTWAETNFPQYFSPVNSMSANYAPYHYRYYVGTGNYIAISSADMNVWVLGPSFGSNLLNVGTIANFLSAAGCPG